MIINMFWNSRFSWWLLIFVLIGDFLVPFLLAFGYKGYSRTRMVLSVLSSTASPVKRFCRFWIILQGVLIAISAVNLFLFYRGVSYAAAVWLMAVMLAFTVMASFVSAACPLAERADKFTPGAVIHILATALGFLALSFAPLLMAVLMFRQYDLPLGGVGTVCFAGALGFQALFLISIGPAHRRGILGLSGLWQRAALFCMYLPLVAAAVKNLLQA